ncbi:MAG: SxtJ family membrane protein [Pseudomonadota bacterium]
MVDTQAQQSKGFIPKTITRDQAKDTGMAMVLICLLVGLLGHRQQFFTISLVLLILNMTWPTAYVPAARLWFGLSHLLGTVMSKVLLTILFFVMVTPLGLVRRMLGKDSLQLTTWKKGRGSVFRVRDHQFTVDDITHPF